MTTTQAPATTTAQRFHAAIKTVRNQGFKITLNVRTCCRSCVENRDLGLTTDNETYAFTFGGQGNAVTFAREDGEAYYAARAAKVRRSYGGSAAMQTARAEAVYFNFGGEHELAVAAALRDAFAAQGFTVEWDGASAHCVKVLFPAPALER